MPRSLVTGGAGFLGAHCSRALLDHDHQVDVLDDLSGGFEDNIPDGVEFVRGSVADADLVAELFRERAFDYVFHLAAYAAEGLSHFIRRFNYHNNVIGSVALINEAIRHEVKCFVFTSSIAVYGPIEPPMSEDMQPRPEDPYGVGKLAVELDLAAAHHQFGLNYIIFRPHNVYGEYQNIGDRYRNVVGIFMNQLMRGEPLTVFGDGEQTRAFSHVDDVAPYIAGSIDNPAAYNDVFNVGADTHHSVNALAEAVMAAMRMQGEIHHLPARLEASHAFSDHSKARDILGMEPSVSLEDGLARMAAWAKEVGARESQPFDGLELDRGLPAVWSAP
jgi:UDP-glucose 4-epimerase